LLKVWGVNIQSSVDLLIDGVAALGESGSREGEEGKVLELHFDGVGM
jgi:hypothetical protein